MHHVDPDSGQQNCRCRGCRGHSAVFAAGNSCHISRAGFVCLADKCNGKCRFRRAKADCLAAADSTECHIFADSGIFRRLSCGSAVHCRTVQAWEIIKSCRRKNAFLLQQCRALLYIRISPVGFFRYPQNLADLADPYWECCPLGNDPVQFTASGSTAGYHEKCTGNGNCGAVYGNDLRVGDGFPGVYLLSGKVVFPEAAGLDFGGSDWPAGTDKWMRFPSENPG